MTSGGNAKKETPQGQFPIKKQGENKQKLSKSIFSELWKLIRSLQQHEIHQCIYKRNIAKSHHEW